MSENVENNTSLASSVEGFFTKTKYLWFALIAIVCVALIVISIVLGVSSSNKKKVSNFLENAIYQYEQSDSENAKQELTAQLEAYVADHGKRKNSIRVYMTLAKCYFDDANYEEALKYYDGAIKCDKNSYLAGIACYDSAVCYEELSKNEEAAKYYEMAYNNKNFHLKPHALFNQARVLETLGEVDKAKDAYSKLVTDYSEDEWANVAKSRLIELSAN